MRNIYVGRQAIFDRSLDVYAYELLFRPGKQNSSGVSQRQDGDMASSEVLINSFMEIGLDRIAGPHRVFVNLTRSLFVDHPQLPFAKDRVVLELLEDIPVDARLLEAVTRLSLNGYSLALDDYIFDPSWDPLLPLVNIIKVEVPALTPEQIEQGIPRLRKHNLQLLAEKIETQEEYEHCRELGFDYFQGYYFARPQVIEGRRLEENQLVVLRLISRLNDPRVEIDDLDRLINQDPGLSYKILRYINSAAIGMPRKVESIRDAVILIGLDRIRAWASLLTLTRLENKPREHLTTALVRAHMCEELVRQSDGSAPETGFTVGLLSILDLMMDRPLREILHELAVSDEIRDALLNHSGSAGQALHCARSIEEQAQDTDGCGPYNDETVYRIYLNASERAFTGQEAMRDS